MILPTAPTFRPPGLEPSNIRDGISRVQTTQARAQAVVNTAGYNPETGVTRLVVNRSLRTVMPPVGTPVTLFYGDRVGGGMRRPAVLAQVYAHGILVRTPNGVGTFFTYIDLYVPTARTRIRLPREYTERVNAVCARLRRLSPGSISERIANENRMRCQEEDAGGGV
jgi:hypothetical protein